jgi:hypothetical protein
MMVSVLLHERCVQASTLRSAWPLEDAEAGASTMDAAAGGAVRAGADEQAGATRSQAKRELTTRLRYRPSATLGAMKDRWF